SELAWGWSKRAMIGLQFPWTRSVLCAIQAVAIEPPRRRVRKRPNTAFLAHLRDSVAALFHLSRIIRARQGDRAGPVRRAGESNAAPPPVPCPATARAR